MSASPTFAIATPSYARDFERCRLLCDSIDRHVRNLSTHYILIDPVDLALFRTLEGPRRRILTDAELLPGWLTSRPDPFNQGRRIWTGLGALMRGVPPLRGWHVQQLRKFAVAALIEEDVILFADSDVVFLRPLDLASQMRGEAVRLFRKDRGISRQMRPQKAWLASAAQMLGAPMPALPADDFINPLVTWRRDTTLNLLRHVEEVTGRSWPAGIARRRHFSEYLIYGAFVRLRAEEMARHWIDSESLAATTWFAHEMPEGGAGHLGRAMSAGQVALCVQSFIDVPAADLRKLFEGGAISA